MTWMTALHLGWRCPGRSLCPWPQWGACSENDPVSRSPVTQTTSYHLTGVPAPLCCWPPVYGVGWGGAVLTVAHALQEVFEGFSQLPGLQEGGTSTCFDWLLRIGVTGEASPTTG